VVRHCGFNPSHQDLVRAVNKDDRTNITLLSIVTPPVRPLIRERERGTIEHLLVELVTAVRNLWPARCGSMGSRWCSSAGLAFP